jgi:regulator of PEP synthase PpsR (kinase-PPPase family)
METAPRLFNLHLVSDSTGETLNHVARACVAQFDGVDADQHIWSLIRSERQMAMVCESITARPGVVLFTVINEGLRQKLIDHCRSLKLPCVPVLEPVLSGLSHYLDTTARKLPGRQHTLDQDYYKRIEAMEFALSCDDGQGLDKIHNADVILLGVSRTSKTPTCLYLANRGLFAANIPIVHGVELPPVLFELTTPLIIGLTRDPVTLVDIRKNRLRVMQETCESDYVDSDAVAEEVAAARRICLKYNWPLLDVTRRSIEETSAEILIHLNRREEDKKV